MENTVSIIIPAYNAEQYIAQTLRSVCGQTFSNIEIIVVNDGSTDGTEALVKDFVAKDNRIILLNQQNAGLSAARNIGFKNARGQYLCIFDSDDIMMPQKIEKQVSFLQSNPACDFVYSDVYHFIDGTQKVYFGVLPEVSDVYTTLIQRGNYINPNTVLFSHSVYEKYGGFDETLRGSEDWDYWLTLSRQGVQFCHIKEGLTLYRVRNTGLSGNRVTVCSTAVRMLEKQKSYTQDPEIMAMFDKTIYQWELRLMVAYLQNKDWQNAQPYSKKDSLFKLFYIAYRILPFSIINYFYELIKWVRFSLRFKKAANDSVRQFLAL